LLYFVLIN